MKLEKYLEQKHKAAMRGQIRRGIMLMNDYERLRKVAQYTSKLWLEEQGGELIIKEE
ncbi:MAG: hypothetical protein ACLRNW_28480 [Neglectibacter sp.]